MKMVITKNVIMGSSFLPADSEVDLSDAEAENLIRIGCAIKSPFHAQTTLDMSGGSDIPDIPDAPDKPDAPENPEMQEAHTAPDRNKTAPARSMKTNIHRSATRGKRT